MQRRTITSRLESKDRGDFAQEAAPSRHSVAQKSNQKQMIGRQKQSQAMKFSKLIIFKGREGRTCSLKSVHVSGGALGLVTDFRLNQNCRPPTKECSGREFRSVLASGHEIAISKS